MKGVGNQTIHVRSFASFSFIFPEPPPSLPPSLPLLSTALSYRSPSVEPEYAAKKIEGGEKEEKPPVVFSAYLNPMLEDSISPAPWEGVGVRQQVSERRRGEVAPALGCVVAGVRNSFGGQKRPGKKCRARERKNRRREKGGGGGQV